MKSRLLIGALVLGLAALVLTHPPHEKQAHAQAGGGTGIIALENGWNISSVNSGAAVFASNFHPTQAVSTLRVTVVLGSTAALYIKETDGTHTFTSALNGETALTANCYYTFVIACRYASAPGGVTGPTGMNFVVGAPTTVPVLRVEEVSGGVD